MLMTNVSLMTNVIMSVIFGPLLLTGFSAGYDSHFPIFWYVLYFLLHVRYSKYYLLGICLESILSIMV